MKILIVNYRYFVSGGPEKYLFKLKALLERHGHEVIPFSITYDQNEASPYASYFAEPLSDPSEVYFRDQGRSLRVYAKTLERSLYSKEVYEKLGRLISDVKPDVAYVLHWQRKLSPSVFACLRDKRLPFAVFLADFGMICPNAHLLRDGKPCELCVGGELRHSVKYSCVQGSRAASAVNYAAVRFHQARGYYDLIRKFIAPSRFMETMMVKGGFAPERVVTVPMFVNAAESPAAPAQGPPVIAYVGRLDHTKGVHVLLQAAELLRLRSPSLGQFAVRLAGTGEEGYTQELRSFVREHQLDNVSFEGWCSADELSALLRGSRCAVVPSIWYENTPNTALESMAEGIPIVASDHGCFPELVEGGRTGALFAPADPEALAGQLERVLIDREGAHQMGLNALEFVRREHSAERHYELLMGAFAEVGAPAQWTRSLSATK